jgi:hypothetical protein
MGLRKWTTIASHAPTEYWTTLAALSAWVPLEGEYFTPESH